MSDSVTGKVTKDADFNNLNFGKNITQCNGRVRSRVVDACAVNTVVLRTEELIINDNPVLDLATPSPYGFFGDNVGATGSPYAQTFNLDPLGPNLATATWLAPFSGGLATVFPGFNQDSNLFVSGVNGTEIEATAEGAGVYQTNASVEMQLATDGATGNVTVHTFFTVDNTVLGPAELFGNRVVIPSFGAGTPVNVIANISHVLSLAEGYRLGFGVRVEAENGVNLTPQFGVSITMVRVGAVAP
jgi:hypothetical protein